MQNLDTQVLEMQKGTPTNAMGVEGMGSIFG
jgi:hypothetical protein